MKNQMTQVVMLDKKYLTKKMDLPGLSGVKGEKVDGVPGVEGLPGVPYEEEEEEASYCSACGGKLGAHTEPDEPHKEPDNDLDDINHKENVDNDHDDDCDCDECQEKEKHIPKQIRAFINKMSLTAKRMFGGATPSMVSPIYQEVAGVAVIHINGELGKRIPLEEQAGRTDVDTITEACKIAMNSNVKAAVLWVNSPGGTSTGVQECGSVIKKLTEKMPVFAFTDTLAASAAYWLCACTNGIFVTPSSEVGSIGVYAKVVDMSKALEAQGINVQIFQAGSLKTMGQPEVTLTEEETKLIQTDIDEQWVKFKTLVSDNRGGVSEEFMQGQLLNAEKAVEANLADAIVPDFEAVLSLINTK